MKSTSIIFITLNPIDNHLSHVSQMHTHAYIRRVCDLEPYSGIQGQRKHLWTLVDLTCICAVWTFFLIILYVFSFHISFQKTLSSPISSTRPFDAQAHDTTVSRCPNSHDSMTHAHRLHNQVPHTSSDLNKTYFGSHSH